MDYQAYQKARIQSFFNLGLTFSVDGDRLQVDGFQQWPPAERQELTDSIRQNKAVIMAEVKKMQDRLKELAAMAENSEWMTPEAVARISEEGSEIIDILTPEMVRQIFNQSSEKELEQ